MQVSDQTLINFFAQNEKVVKLELTKVSGSSPRNVGTVMYVSCEELWGTVGGGQLEFMLIEQARNMLSNNVPTINLDIPLGPEIGQCCGGRVSVLLIAMSLADKNNACTQMEKTLAALPHVYVLGAGYVGRALANQLQHLPVQCILIDSREEELALCNANVEARLSAIPELNIQNAPSGSAYIVLTHDHGLDFLLTSAALARSDAAYVGMIGSATKRSKFTSWCRENCDQIETQDLNCPIGANGSRDKRPSVIAAFVAAEVIADLTSEPAVTALKTGFGLQKRKQLTGGGNHHGRRELHL